MSTKRGGSGRDVPELLETNDHVQHRWTLRGAPGTSLLNAWNEAHPLEPRDDRPSDRLRYHAPSDSLLAAKNGALITVLNAASAARPYQRRLRAAGFTEEEVNGQ